MDGRETVLGVSQVDSDESGARIQLSVKDTGIGIPKESQDRVFGEFEQADQSATRVHGGSGLGLTTSRRLEVGDEEIVDTTLAVYASEAPGFMARIMPTIPETTGVDIEVPLMVTYPPPVLSDKILTPGAVIGRARDVFVLENFALSKFSSTAETTITPSTLEGMWSMASSLELPAEAKTITLLRRAKAIASEITFGV